MVECNLPKVKAAGSIPVSRSISHQSAPHTLKLEKVSEKEKKQQNKLINN